MQKVISWTSPYTPEGLCSEFITLHEWVFSKGMASRMVHCGGVISNMNY